MNLFPLYVNLFLLWPLRITSYITLIVQAKVFGNPQKSQTGSVNEESCVYDMQTRSASLFPNG